MRGLWDNEKPLSPALLRSALAMVGVFLALSAAVMLIIAVASVAAGIALPFGIWLGLRILADLLVVLNRSHDRLQSIVELAGGTPPQPAAPEPVFASNGTRTAAGDDGPRYPAED